MLLIDGRYGGNHGIGRYAREVIPQVAAAFPHRLLMTGPPANRDFLRLGAATLRPGISAFYSPGFHPGWPSRVPQVITVHDLIHVAQPSERTAGRLLYYKKLVAPSIKRAGLVFTVSEFSKGQIVDLLDIDPLSVTVTGNGCSVAFLDALPGLKARDDGYVLCVANAKPYKNMTLMIRAARSLPRGMRVVCVGISEREAREIGNGEIDDRFSFVSNMPDEELAKLYAACSVVALPSKMEGFGLPALEGLALGKPVVYCAEVLNEIVGGLGIRVTDPDDGEEFAAALLEASASGGDLAAARKRSALRYSWAEVGGRIVTALKTHGAS